MKTTSYLPDKFRQRLQEYRVTRGWSLLHMAGVLHVSVGSLHKYENGKGIPTPLTAARMRRCLPQLFEDAQNGAAA